jgi:hypothetical protein
MPGLLAFLPPASGEMFPRLALTQLPAVRCRQTDWMGWLPAALADAGRGMSHTTSSRLREFAKQWRIFLPSLSWRNHMGLNCLLPKRSSGVPLTNCLSGVQNLFIRVVSVPVSVILPLFVLWCSQFV